MIALINRTRIFVWITELKPFHVHDYKGYSWELLSNREEIDYFKNSSSMVYRFLFYDMDGLPYAVKSIETKINEKIISISLLARTIIDSDNDFN